MKEKAKIIDIKMIPKSLGFLALLFLFGSIPLIFFELLHIYYQNFSIMTKIIYNLICDIAFLTLIIFAYRKTIIPDFKEFKKNLISNLEYALKYWGVGFIIMVISNLILTFVLQKGLSQNEETIRSLTNIAPLFMIFEVAIYAPLTEELIFRKGFKDVFKSKWLFVISSGFVFGFLHIISSLNSLTDLLFLIPYCSLGFSFALLYYKTDNLFFSISMHAMHNTIAIILYIIGVSS